MDFPTIVINSLSVLMISIVMAIAYKRRADSGSKQLIVVSVFMLIWAVGSFTEIAVNGQEQKIFWRNFTQIGTFYTPPAALVFAIAYTGILKKHSKKIAIASGCIQTGSLIFILTDGWHHLARSAVSIAGNPGCETLVVKTTEISKILISLNFVFMAAAFAILIASIFRTAKDMKKQVLCVLAGTAVCIAYSFIKIASNETFGVSVPISAVFALADICMILGVFRYDLLLLEPIARNEVFNIVDQGVVIASQRGKIVDINRAALKILEPTGNSGGNPLERAEKVIAHFPDWHEAVINNRDEQYDIMVEQSGDLHYYLCQVYAVKNKRQKTIGSISLIRDVTEQKKNTDLLKQRAEKDGLTGADNRKTFIERAEQSLAEGDGPVCLLFIDIDFFKNVNDSYGHIFGDQVLIEICGLVCSELKDDAYMGRMGGEEFAVFKKASLLKEAVGFAERLRACVAEHTFLFDGNPVGVTISIGVAFGQNLSFDALYREADVNLYKAKQAGRNCVRFRE